MRNNIINNGVFSVTFDSHAEHSESMMAVLVRRFCDVCKCKASLATRLSHQVGLTAPQNYQGIPTRGLGLT